jgi:hypothetical protein
MMPWPPSFAVFQLADGRWQVLETDDDPRRPRIRRVMIVPAPGYPAVAKKPPVERRRPHSFVRKSAQTSGGTKF